MLTQPKQLITVCTLCYPLPLIHGFRVISNQLGFSSSKSHHYLNIQGFPWINNKYSLISSGMIHLFTSESQILRVPEKRIDIEWSMTQ